MRNILHRTHQGRFAFHQQSARIERDLHGVSRRNRQIRAQIIPMGKRWREEGRRLTDDCEVFSPNGISDFAGKLV